MNFANMTSAHFIFIPVVLFVGIVIGLDSRFARGAGRVCDGNEETQQEIRRSGNSVRQESCLVVRPISSVAPNLQSTDLPVEIR